jgi:hypothetical protein
MNYLAHGWRFTGDPYFLAGTAVPDWLCVADRSVRVRSKRAAQWTSGNSETAAVARGICQHHADDHWFHGRPVFAELSLEFSARVRRALPADEGLRAWFVGHVLVELLLDAALIEQQPALLATYYAAMDRVDPGVVERVVNQIGPRSTDRLQRFVQLFCQVRFLYDYTDDGKLVMRLNQVMQRAALPALPDSFVELLPAMREAVRRNQIELLGSPSNPEPPVSSL